MRFAIFSLFIAATLLSTSHGRAFNPISLLSDGLTFAHLNCESWRWAVETNNARDWSVVPKQCVRYVKEYMDGKVRPGKDRQYVVDCNTVAEYVNDHILKVNPTENGKDVWIFDLDETLLSDLPYYRRASVQYGAKPYNRTKFYEWVATGKVPGLEPFVSLYNQVLKKGFKIVILSGTSEDYREVRERNLRNVGVDNWERLILRKTSERGIPALKYKSDKRTELVEEGYKIVANIGDQWSDLLGPNPGERTFKVPNPMFYVP